MIKENRINWMETFCAREGLMTDVKLWNISCTEFIKDIDDFYGEQLQTKDAEIKDLVNKFQVGIDYAVKTKKQDALIKELIECVEFYGDDSKWCANHVVDENYNVIERSDIDRDYFNQGQHCGGKKARTLLSSESVKAFKADDC